MDFLVDETMLDAMIEETQFYNHEKLTHDLIKELLGDTPQTEEQLEQYQNMTLGELLHMVMQKEEESQSSQEQQTTKKEQLDPKKCTVFGKQPDATIQVYYEPDNIAAKIVITSPKAGGNSFSPQMLYQTIQDCGICYGVKKSYLKRLEKTPIYDTVFVIAQGRLPTVGEKGNVFYHFDIQPNRAPKVNPETGMVDYRELSFVQAVQEGDLLCEIKKPTAGDEGIDIFGKPIPGKKEMNLDISAGKNTQAVENESEIKIYATCSGEVHLQNNVISVEKLLMLDNIDISKGNVVFDGTVHIKHNVYSGFSVKATGNIVIGGVVEDASLNAGGDIVIYGGIKGNLETQIVAKGSLSALFIESATIQVYQNIYADYIMSSNISCDEKIVLSGKHGSLIGGKCQAVEINLREVGNHAYTATEVTLCYPPRLLEKQAELKEELQKSQKAIKQLQKQLKTENSQQVKMLLFQTKMQCKSLQTKLQDVETKLEKLEKNNYIGIYVGSKMYPNVSVKTDDRTYHNQELRYSCFIKKHEGNWMINLT